MDRSTSIRNVNLLYLVTLVTLLVGSVLLSGQSLGWRIIINEAVFLGLPLVICLLVAGQKSGDTLRLRGVSWRVASLSLLVGLGVWRFDTWLAAAVNGLLGYTIPLPPEALNVTALDNIAMALGTALLAPFIEESMFRGVIQSAYERLGPVRAIAGSTVLFVMIHQELAQSFALLPVALALGYVAWRTGSIVPAIMIHLGNNGQAVLVSLFEGGSSRRMAFTPSAAGALVGGLVAVAGLWLLNRATRRPDRGKEKPKRGWLARNWLGRNWPIIPVVPIYLAGPHPGRLQRRHGDLAAERRRLKRELEAIGPRPLPDICERPGGVTKLGQPTRPSQLTR
jgi:membrane protease YdiL (CAAX protease family)